MTSFLLPLFKYKKCSQNDKYKTDKIVPAEFFPEIPNRKAAKYDKCDLAKEDKEN